MTAKPKKTKGQPGFPKWERIGALRAAVENELLMLAKNAFQGLPSRLGGKPRKL
jgi:hypothetical protein